jgi:hypothetical protein
MSNRVSRGQAEAVLNAGPSGGSAILYRSGGALRGAPADNEVRAAISLDISRTFSRDPLT